MIYIKMCQTVKVYFSHFQCQLRSHLNEKEKLVDSISLFNEIFIFGCSGTIEIILRYRVQLYDTICYVLVLPLSFRYS